MQMANHIDWDKLDQLYLDDKGVIHLEQMSKEKPCDGINFLMPFLPVSKYFLAETDL